MFGYHAVQRFLRDNRLMYMVRAHEVQEEGFRSHFPRYGMGCDHLMISRIISSFFVRVHTILDMITTSCSWY